MTKVVLSICLGLFLFIISGCNSCERQVERDIEKTYNTLHSGKYIGDRPVYVVDFSNGTYEYESACPIYLQKDGSYKIEYSDGEEYVLRKLDNPKLLPECEYSYVRWIFRDSNHYIEDVPN